MTLEEAKSKASIRIQLFDAKGANKVIDQIFNDHETQLKLASDVYSTDKMHMYQEIKAKDEEIERLKDQLSSVHNIMYRNGYSDAIDCYDTFGNFNTRHKPNAKARSIVAMLFWEWKKRNRLYIENKYRNPSANLALYKQANLMQEVFQEAYKMIKDTK